jgi:hypothetical protein
MISPKDKAIELMNRFNNEHNIELKESKRCCLIAVNEIINSNPHSNPFNTSVYSTMEYWKEVKSEIEKL